jgi:hypothetical protein
VLSVHFFALETRASRVFKRCALEFVPDVIYFAVLAQGLPKWSCATQLCALVAEVVSQPALAPLMLPTAIAEVARRINELIGPPGSAGRPIDEATAIQASACTDFEAMRNFTVLSVALMSRVSMILTGICLVLIQAVSVPQKHSILPDRPNLQQPG